MRNRKTTLAVRAVRWNYLAHCPQKIEQTLCCEQQRRDAHLLCVDAQTTREANKFTFFGQEHWPQVADHKSRNNYIGFSSAEKWTEKNKNK